MSFMCSCMIDFYECHCLYYYTYGCILDLLLAPLYIMVARVAV
jgi:hypothetical protein